MEAKDITNTLFAPLPIRSIIVNINYFLYLVSTKVVTSEEDRFPVYNGS